MRRGIRVRCARIALSAGSSSCRRRTFSGGGSSAAAAAQPQPSWAHQQLLPEQQQQRALLPSWANPPAARGDTLDSVDTPALLLDMAAFDANCASLRASLDQFGGAVTARVHTKAHKSATLAHRQLGMLGPEVGRGVCCQTVSEVAAMLEGGVGDILLTNQVVGRRKIERFVQLALEAQAMAAAARPGDRGGERGNEGGGARLSCLVDHAANVEELHRACTAAGAQIECLVEVDVGQGRCGVAPGTPAAELALEIERRRPALRFAGLHCYHGLTQHIRSLAERRQAVLGPVAAAVRQSLDALGAAGLHGEHGAVRVTGGGERFYGCGGR
jgi:3-hydroxy-D-aspartate aldolase